MNKLLRLLSSVAVFLFGTPAITAQSPVDTPTPVTCVITNIDKKDIITLSCPAPNKLDSILDIPLDQWPEKWEGKRTMGSKFPAMWTNGAWGVLPTKAWTIRQMTRETPDYERTPVNQ